MGDQGEGGWLEAAQGLEALIDERIRELERQIASGDKSRETKLRLRRELHRAGVEQTISLHGRSHKVGDLECQEGRCPTVRKRRCPCGGVIHAGVPKRGKYVTRRCDLCEWRKKRYCRRWTMPVAIVGNPRREGLYDTVTFPGTPDQNTSRPQRETLYDSERDRDLYGPPETWPFNHER